MENMSIEDIIHGMLTEDNKEVAYAEVLYRKIAENPGIMNKERFSELEKLANKDTASASLLYFVGVAYMDGLQGQTKVKRNHEKASLFLKRSFDKGAIYTSIPRTILFIDRELDKTNPNIDNIMQTLISLELYGKQQKNKEIADWAKENLNFYKTEYNIDINNYYNNLIKATNGLQGTVQNKSKIPNWN